jgi:hypothetical protein
MSERELISSKEWFTPWRAAGLAVYDTRGQLVAHTGITGNRSMQGEQLERMAAMIADAVNAHSSAEPFPDLFVANGNPELSDMCWNCGEHSSLHRENPKGSGLCPTTPRSAPPPIADRVITPVFMICNAYESGFGHGRELDNLPNPYSAGSDEHAAYAIGYSEGERRRRTNGSSGYCNSNAHELCNYINCMCKCHASTKWDVAPCEPSRQATVCHCGDLNCEDHPR